MFLVAGHLHIVIASAKSTPTRIGLCGQAPSDMPEFAKFLLEQGIGNSSFDPDSLLKGMENIRLAEDTLRSIHSAQEIEC